MTVIAEDAKQAGKRLKPRGEDGARVYALKRRDQNKPNEPSYQYWNFVARLISSAPQQAPEMRVVMLEAHIEGTRAALGSGRYKEDPRCPYESESAEAGALAAGFKEVAEART